MHGLTGSNTQEHLLTSRSGLIIHWSRVRAPPAPRQRVFLDFADSVTGYSSFMRVGAGRVACRQASRTTLSAWVAETVRRVWPASCACHLASDGARLNR